MAYKSISGKATEQPAKDISSPIAGSLVSAGRSEVTIKSIEKVGMKLKLTLRNNFKETHIGNVFLLDKTGEDISFRLKQLISSASSGPQELTKIYEDLDNSDVGTLLGLSGREIGVELKASAGYTVSVTPSGFEAENKTFKTLTELRNAMLQAGKVQSYLNIAEFYRLDRIENEQATNEPDIMDEFLGASPVKAKQNNTTNKHKSTSKVDTKASGPDTTGWL